MWPTFRIRPLSLGLLALFALAPAARAEDLHVTVVVILANDKSDKIDNQDVMSFRITCSFKKAK